MQAPEEIELIWAKGSPGQNEALRLREEEGLSYKQVGIRMGITRQRAMILAQKARGWRKIRIARSAR